MASSNRHWPSLFKSKPCSTHNQWQQDINPSSLLAGGCQKSPYAAGCEERSPEPKPRWNPKPEQIRILEAIFNSGMVNPPRDEIRRIRAQLQEYGQVGDANVFYWFQNRKSRSKHKQRHLLSARSQPRSAAPSPPTTTAPSAAASSSSSSSSDRSSGSEMIPTPVSSAAATAGGMATMINASVDQTYFHGPVEFSGESFILQGPQGYCLSASELQGIFGVDEQGTGVSPGLWGEPMGPDGWKSGLDETKIKMQWHYGAGAAAAPTPAVPSAAGVGRGATTAAVAANTASPVNVIHGFGAVGSGTRSTVFINEVAFEVGEGPLNLREAFGEEAVLLHSSGHPVIVDEWGLTLHPLQHGASYYLV